MNASAASTGYLRAVLLTLGGVVLVAALALAALVIWRVALANAFGPKLVEGQTGIPAQFTVTRITAEETVLTSLHVRDGPEVDDLRVGYTLVGLLDGRIETVTVSGIRGGIRVSETGDIRVDGLPSALFAPASATDEEAPAAAPPLTRLRLDGIDIAADTPAGPSRIKGTADIAFAPDASGPLPETIALNLRDVDGDSAIAGNLSLAPDRIEADFHARIPLSRWGAFLPGIRAAEGAFTLDGTLSGDPAGLETPVLGGPAARFRRWVARDLLTGSLDMAWTGLALTGTDGSQADMADNSLRYRITDRAVAVTASAPLESRITGVANRLAPVRELLRAVVPAHLKPTWEAVLTADEMRTRLVPDGEAASMTFEVTEDGWRIQTPPKVSIATGPLTLSLQPGEIDLGDRLLNHRIGGLTAMLDADGLPLARGTVTGRLSARLGEVTAYAVNRGVSVDFDSRVAFDSLALADFGVTGVKPLSGDFDLSGRIDAGPDQISIHPAPGGRITLAAQPLAGDVALTAPLDISLRDDDTAPSRIHFDPASAAGLSADMPLSISGLPLRIGARQLSATPFRVRLDHDARQSSAHLDGLTLSLPSDSAEIEEIALDGTWDGSAGDVAISFSRLIRRGDALLDRKSVLEGRITFPEGHALHYEGQLSVADGALEGAVLYALPDTPGSAARFAFDGAPIHYSPDGLQPGRLSPLFADVFPETEGALEIDIDARIGASNSGVATVSLADFGFALGPTRLQEATGTVAFDLSKPPATEPDQALSALLIVPGLGRLPVEARFSLGADARLSIAALTLNSLGGALTLTNAVVDPLNDRMTGDLGIAGLNIDELATLADIDGVAGSGTLIGTLPFVVTPKGIGIDAGVIEAEGSGRLRIDNPTVNAALSGQHQSVQLLLNALKDFHYDDLALTFDLPEGGNGTLGLRLAGNNPDTLDGHPFNININIESDYSKLFASLQQGFLVTDRMLDRFRDQIVK